MLGFGARSSWACLHLCVQALVWTAGVWLPRTHLQATVPVWQLGRAGAASVPTPGLYLDPLWQRGTQVPLKPQLGFSPSEMLRWGPSRACCEEPLWGGLGWTPSPAGVGLY